MAQSLSRRHFEFAADEALHTVNSGMLAVDSFRALAGRSGSSRGRFGATATGCLAGTGFAPSDSA